MAMRFLTTCLLLFCFQSFVVCTIEDGSLTFVQEKVKTSKVSKITSLNCKKLALNGFVNNPTIEFASLAKQQLQDQVNVVFSAVSYHLSIVNPLFILTNLYRYKSGLNSFILNYLYPKHTFW